MPSDFWKGKWMIFALIISKAVQHRSQNRAIDKKKPNGVQK